VRICSYCAHFVNKRGNKNCNRGLGTSVYPMSSVEATTTEKNQQIQSIVRHDGPSDELSFAMLFITTHHCCRLGRISEVSTRCEIFAGRFRYCSRKKQFTVRCVIVTTHVVGKRSFLKQYGEVQAGRLHHESMHCHPNTFSLDKDGLGSDALLLLMPQRSTTGTAHDFAMVMKSNHSTSTVSNFVKKEMNAIRARVTSSRSGPASGVFDPLSGDKCRSFTQVTKKPTTLYVSPPTRTGGMVALYYNHSQRLKRCNHGYRDLAMNRLSRGMKKREAEACKHYKQILTTEGYNFFIFSVVSQANPVEGFQLS
jgi:hypothetical protein